MLNLQGVNLGQMDFDQIINSNIQPGRTNGIPGRIKRAHQYWIKEAERVRGLLLQPTHR